MPGFIRDGGTWKPVKDIHIRDGGTWKPVSKGYARDNGTWKEFHSAERLPAGIILPFIGNTVPTGWNLWTKAGSMYIMGADASHPVGSNEAMPSNSINIDFNTAGSHSSGSSVQVRQGGGGTGDFRSTSAVDHFGHSHYSTVDVNALPPSRTYGLIQSLEETDNCPANSCVLSHTALSTADKQLIHTTIDRFLLGTATWNGTATNGGSSSAWISGWSSYSSNHNHTQGFARANTEIGFAAATGLTNAGAHQHSFNGSADLNTRQRYLTLYSSTSVFAPEIGMIGLWESATAPPDWALCDGTNGTPDMRGYFIRIGSEAQRNNASGDNNFYVSGHSSTDGEHSHGSTGTTTTGTNEFYSGHTSAGAHNHFFSGGGTVMPPYYALSVIMKIS